MSPPFAITTSTNKKVTGSESPRLHLNVKPILKAVFEITPYTINK